MKPSRYTRAFVAILIALSMTPADAASYGSFRSAPNLRTPTTSTISRPTAPSGGGYGSYRSRTPSAAPTPRPTITGSDRAISRESSGSALNDMYRQDRVKRERAAPRVQETETRSSPTRDNRPTWAGQPSVRERTPSIAVAPAPTPTWRRQSDWDIPSYARPRESYGSWNPLLMWYLISSLNRPSSADFFHNHRNDPGYRQWRTEADAQAATNPELRKNLDRLDGMLDMKKDEPINEAFIPAGIDPAVAKATTPEKPSSGGAWIVFLLLLILVVGGLLLMMRRTQPSRTQRDRPMKNTDVLINLARSKMSSEPLATPSRFKVGQVITVEATPFLLAQGSKVVRPDTRGGTTSIERIGTLSGSGNLTRLYLDDINFLQLSESADTTISDCRYFSRIDEVYPQSADEWRIWIDEAGGWQDLELGILSDPKFLVPEDTLYDRIWSPGDQRVPPKKMTETQTDLSGERTIRITAQLYARALPNAPDRQEYLLVEVRQEGAQASVMLYAGIDLPPSSLGL